MKKYIFITYSIFEIGGVQNYLRTLTKQLEKDGWKTFCIFHHNRPPKDCSYRELNRFVSGNVCYLDCISPDELSDTWELDLYIMRILSVIEYKPSDEVVIESHSGIFARWGEVIAERTKAKHMVFLADEYFDPSYKIDRYIDFYFWKYNRKELLGISYSTTNRLFDGYYETPNKYKRHDFYHDLNVDDIESDFVNTYKRSNWNIAYMGRVNKGYVQEIISAVCSLADLNPQKRITFTIIGDFIQGNISRVETPLYRRDNIEVLSTGFFETIPAGIFNLFDIVIAGSGCAAIASQYVKNLIIPHSKLYNRCGFCGVQVKDNNIYFDDSITYINAFTKFFENNEWKDKCVSIYNYNSLEKYKEHWENINDSNKNNDYYSFDNNNVLPVKELHQIVIDVFLELCYWDTDFLRYLCDEINKVPTGLFGIGYNGKRMIRVLKDARFNCLLDNNVTDCDEYKVVKPMFCDMDNADRIIICVSNDKSNMETELRRMNYDGQIIYLYDFIRLIVTNLERDGSKYKLSVLNQYRFEGNASICHT